MSLLRIRTGDCRGTPLRPFGAPPPADGGRRRIHAFPRLRGKVPRRGGRGSSHVMPSPVSLMQRLYLQFYATILLVLAVFVGAAALTWKLVEEETPQYLDIA